MEGLDLFWQQREDPISVVDPSAVFGELLFNADIARNRCVSDSSAIPPILVTMPWSHRVILTTILRAVPGTCFKNLVTKLHPQIYLASLLTTIAYK